MQFTHHVLTLNPSFIFKRNNLNDCDIILPKDSRFVDRL